MNKVTRICCSSTDNESHAPGCPKADKPKLFLLLYDDFVKDYYFHGVFDDNKEGRDAIDGITSRCFAYKVIKGVIIRDVEHAKYQYDR
jgi:hypothetical protein